MRFEAQQYLEALEAGVAGLDVESLTEEQLDEVLDRLDPQTGELTPAGEEFIGELVKQGEERRQVRRQDREEASARSPARCSDRCSRSCVALINPLLRRVLSFAIGRLPAAAPAGRANARQHASPPRPRRRGPRTKRRCRPANLTDVEALAESFDAALAEAMIAACGERVEGEAFASVDGERRGREPGARGAGRSARRADRPTAATPATSEDLAPAVEQFVPALLGALRLGINLVGRPKVVGFLAKYLGQLISALGRTAALRAALERDRRHRPAADHARGREAGEARRDEAGPVALASVIEDTVRQLAESEDYVFENEDLMQLATAEAFSQAVATHFPPRFVRPALQQAPSLGGTFVDAPAAQRPAVPQVQPHAGGRGDARRSRTRCRRSADRRVGAVLRAAGATFPIRARMHIYQAAAGTTLPRMMRIDRRRRRRAAATSAPPTSIR